MVRVNHFLTLSKPALVSTVSKKIVFQRELADFGVQSIQIHPLVAFGSSVLKDSGCALQEFALPGCDLRRVDIILLGEVRQGLFTPQSL
jgi:hypothetical protein